MKVFNQADIVERLRERAGKYDECDWHGEIELEAANEIELLRARLTELDNCEKLKASINSTKALINSNSTLMAEAWRDANDDFYCGKVVSTQSSAGAVPNVKVRGAALLQRPS